MKIATPTLAPDDPRYDFECQQALELAVLDLVDQATQVGWSTKAAFKALAEVVGNQTLAYENDPDPQDAEAETGSNEFRSADRLIEKFIAGREVR